MNTENLHRKNKRERYSPRPRI